MAAMGGLLAMPLAALERDGLKTALAKAGLPADDIGDPHLLFWRFESRANVPAGFGGLEIHHGDALLRSIVTLPPVRRLGMGSAIVAVLEIEARARKCRSIYLVTTSEAGFFDRLGYTACSRNDVPEAIAKSPHFSRLCCAAGTVMVKQTLP
jgi:N-acetylglutamate synthase-like GNAT family acetyltransferase